MAPYQGPSREAAIKQLRSKTPSLPITLGLHTPAATLTFADGVWSLTLLGLDEDAAAKAGRAALAGGESWMPEHTWQHLKHGKVLAASAALEAFIDQLQALHWPW